ncbi:MAG: ribbon-helix-helix domain-containing protein [Coriobacteriia bacterium]|nr:ribbon-helix-helix domain-containing protein [Coriobacteriia bacterium]
MKNDELHKKFGVTDAQLDERAAEYESESWEGMEFGRIVQGRPKICDEELKPLTIKVPASRIAAIQESAARRGVSRSEFVRQAIDNELATAS